MESLTNCLLCSYQTLSHWIPRFHQVFLCRRDGSAQEEVSKPHVKLFILSTFAKFEDSPVLSVHELCCPWEKSPIIFRLFDLKKNWRNIILKLSFVHCQKSGRHCLSNVFPGFEYFLQQNNKQSCIFLSSVVH